MHFYIPRLKPHKTLKVLTSTAIALPFLFCASSAFSTTVAILLLRPFLRLLLGGKERLVVGRSSFTRPLYGCPVFFAIDSTIRAAFGDIVHDAAFEVFCPLCTIFFAVPCEAPNFSVDLELL